VKTNQVVQEALEGSLALGETGIAVAAYHRGELIVDAVAGIADPATGRPVDERTLFPIFSVTKGVTALAVHLQAERGLIELDAVAICHNNMDIPAVTDPERTFAPVVRAVRQIVAEREGTDR